jgi:hypothetical protein
MLPEKSSMHRPSNTKPFVCISSVTMATICLPTGCGVISQLSECHRHRHISKFCPRMIQLLVLACVHVHGLTNYPCLPTTNREVLAFRQTFS